MSGKSVIRVITSTERDAGRWEEGDVIHTIGVGPQWYGDDDAWHGGLDVPGTVPEVPATPDAQDVVDALVTLGLVTQAAP